MSQKVSLQAWSKIIYFVNVQDSFLLLVGPASIVRKIIIFDFQSKARLEMNLKRIKTSDLNFL